MSFNIIATIASLLAGVIYFFPGEIMYRLLRGTVPGPLLIAMYFLGLALCVFIVIFILSKILGNYRHLHYTFGKTILMVLLFTIIGTPLVSAGTEFLYELGIQAASEPKNYAFLIDNSDSMNYSDPTNQRRIVVEDVANSLPEDANVGIYTFDDTTKQIYGMGDAKPGSISIPEWAVQGTGLTSLYGCIIDVANAMPSEFTDSATKFIVLTDGNPTDTENTQAIELCNDLNISVSCVGFGNYSEAVFMDLANRTGGNFMAAADADQLKNTVSEIVSKNPINRDLISARNDSTSNSMLYAILRVLFLTLIGLVFAYLKYLNASLPKFSLPFFIICAVSSLIGAIIVEVFYQVYIVEMMGRFALCLAFAFTPLLSNSNYSNIGGTTLRSDTMYGNNTPFTTGNYF